MRHRQLRLGVSKSHKAESLVNAYDWSQGLSQAFPHRFVLIATLRFMAKRFERGQTYI